MTGGFSIIEMIIVLTLSLGVLAMVLGNVVSSTQQTKKILTNQEVLESIFHTVDTMKSDLTKCGMRLQQANEFFKLELIKAEDSWFRVMYGLGSGTLKEPAYTGDTTIRVAGDDYSRSKRKLILYNIIDNVYQFNEIANVSGNVITLAEALTVDFDTNTVMIIIQEVEYKLYEKQACLKRKTGKSYFQPLVENVTDFYIKYFPDSYSILYRLEVNRKEQIRGYIFLTNMVNE